MKKHRVAAVDCTFPDRFIWGAATSAYQIEGGTREDGRGPSTWDMFCKRPGAVFEAQTGDFACDHYHRYRGDVSLMRDLGLSSYRFSVSWPRVLPDGRSAFNNAGLSFYDRLVDALLEAGIQPCCTLFHWDLPHALQQRGGFLNRDVAEWFAEYAALLGAALGDRVKYWITQSEPQCFIGFGHLAGTHAPGLRLDFADSLVAAHNSLRAHGCAARALRATVSNALIGYAVATQLGRPATETQADFDAARAATFAIRDRTHWNNTWWTDPIVFGRYPVDGVALYGADMPSFPNTDWNDITMPIDFIGLNIYRAETFRAAIDAPFRKLAVPAGHPRSGVDWQPITPDAMYYGPRFFHERYTLPIWITENGLSTRDQLFLDGKVHDVQRIDFMHRCLLELRRAITDGARVESYFAWSLLDNFEWVDGYKQRFGLVYVDFGSQRRLPKDSFHWYKRVIATHGASLAGEFAMEPAQVE